MVKFGATDFGKHQVAQIYIVKPDCVVLDLEALHFLPSLIVFNTDD